MFRKKNQKVNENMKQDFINAKEFNSIYSSYRNIIQGIIYAKTKEMSFIPVSDLLKQLSNVRFSNNFTEEQVKIISEMSNEIKILVIKLGYGIIDPNGYYIKTIH